MKFSVNKFLADLEKAGGLSDEDKKAIEKIFGQESIQKQFTQSWIPQSEWSRKQDELRTKIQQEEAKLKTDYETKTKELDNLRLSLSNTLPSEQKKAQALAEAIKQADTDRRTIISKIMGYGDGAEVLKELGLTDPNYSYMPKFDSNTPAQPQIQQPVQQQPAFDENSFRKQFEERYNPLIDQLTNFTLEFPEMRDEYQQLTGKTLSATEFREKAIAGAKQGLNYRQVFEQEYDIPALRQQKYENDLRAKITKELEDKFAQERSQQALPQQGYGNSIFYEQIQSGKPQEYVKQQQEAAQNTNNVIMDAVRDYESQVAKRGIQ